MSAFTTMTAADPAEPTGALPLVAAGAPYDQGLAQGLGHRTQIERLAIEHRRRLGWLGWPDARQAARRGAARAMLRHLIQQHERLQGIAEGAQVRLDALETFESATRVCGVGTAAPDRVLEARFDVHPEIAPDLFLRESRPDAVGFASVELTHAIWTGCLAGINASGVAVVVVEDRVTPEVSLRALAQDLLLRADGREAGLSHLVLRARYAGGSGALLVSDPTGVSRVDLRAGIAQVTSIEPSRSEGGIAQSTVELRVPDRTLVWRRPDGVRQTARLEV